MTATFSISTQSAFTRIRREYFCFELRNDGLLFLNGKWRPSKFTDAVCLLRGEKQHSTLIGTRRFIPNIKQILWRSVKIYGYAIFVDFHNNTNEKVLLVCTEKTFKSTTLRRNSYLAVNNVLFSFSAIF
jgi:hypothetical protein